MTDRPIIFSASMIRALLDGRKTQTRRVAKRSNSTVLGTRWGPKAPWGGLLFDHPKAVARTTSTLMDVIVGKEEATYDPHIDVPFLHPEDAARGEKWEDDEVMYRVRPIWEIGDRLWVRETFSECPLKTYYRATEEDPLEVKWIPSMLMPRRASRLTLEVTGVKVERLQDINEEDAEAEGMFPPYLGDCDPPFEAEAMMISRRAQFRNLWNSIYGPSAWEANQLVYALAFIRCGWKTSIL
jgi:hypothetical protein